MRAVEDLIRKIEADAAERLPLPPNSDAAEKLARCKGFLKVETHRLKMSIARAQAGAKSAGRARPSWTTLLRHLWDRGAGQPVAAGAKGISAASRWWPSAATAARS
jgi:hypothetical protein